MVSVRHGRSNESAKKVRLTTQPIWESRRIRKPVMIVRDSRDSTAPGIATFLLCRNPIRIRNHRSISTEMTESGRRIRRAASIFPGNHRPPPCLFHILGHRAGKNSFERNPYHSSTAVVIRRLFRKRTDLEPDPQPSTDRDRFFIVQLALFPQIIPADFSRLAPRHKQQYDNHKNAQGRHPSVHSPLLKRRLSTHVRGQLEQETVAIAYRAANIPSKPLGSAQGTGKRINHHHGLQHKRLRCRKYAENPLQILQTYTRNL